MFAPRARIGSISPTVAETLFYDFYRFAPAGVGLVGVTCSIERLEQEEFEKVFNVVEDACRYLASRDVQFVVHHGVPLVASQGPGFDYQLMERMEKATGGIPVVTSARAQLEAMRSLGMKSIVIATPYPQEINEAAARFAEADGFHGRQPRPDRRSVQDDASHRGQPHRGVGGGGVGGGAGRRRAVDALPSVDGVRRDSGDRGRAGKASGCRVCG